jgi:hypothetical protein
MPKRTDCGDAGYPQWCECNEMRIPREFSAVRIYLENDMRPDLRCSVPSALRSGHTERYGS